MNNSLFLPRFACKRQQRTGNKGVASTQGKGCHMASRGCLLAMFLGYAPGYTTLEDPISVNIWPKIPRGFLKAWSGTPRPPRRVNVANSDLATMPGLLLLPTFSTKTAAIEVPPCHGTAPGLTGLTRCQKPPSGHHPALCPRVPPPNGSSHPKISAPQLAHAREASVPAIPICVSDGCLSDTLQKLLVTVAVDRSAVQVEQLPGQLTGVLAEKRCSRPCAVT